MRLFFAVLSPCLLAAGLVLAGLPGSSSAEDRPSTATVKLEALKWSQFKERLAASKDAKFTLVDVWATTCGPCKENFPHLIEMHRKYAGKGLAVISLTLDDRTDAKAVAEAEKFLREKNAVFTNVLLDENYGDGFDRLDISTIPAVFLFGADGKELKRFTMDDPNHQFTYEQVEKEVMRLARGSRIERAGKITGLGNPPSGLIASSLLKSNLPTACVVLYGTGCSLGSQPHTDCNERRHSSQICRLRGDLRLW